MTFDLTVTPLAQAPTRDALPSERELAAIAVALVLLRWRESDDRPLVLSQENLEQVTWLLEGPLASLVGDLGSPGARAKFDQLVGLRISRDDACESLFF